MTSWTVNPSPDYCGARIDGADGRSVAHAVQRDAHPTIGQGITQAQALANARLIAAAPELLAMLSEATEALAGGLWDYGPGQDEHAKCNEVIAKCRAAIAKAIGVAA
jgi:hypothetical protein